MKFTNMILFSLLLLLCSSILGEEPASNKPRRIVPFTIASSVDLGVMSEACVRKFQVYVKNTHSEAVEIKFVRSSCPCITLTNVPKGKLVQPGKEIVIEGFIETGKLELGKFSKGVHIELKGYDVFTVMLSGEVKKVVEVLPAATIDLGIYTGEVPWKRIFTIKSLLKTDELSFMISKKSEHFNVNIEKITSQTFNVEVSPRDGAAIGRFNESLVLAANGMPGYDFVVLRMTGELRSLQLKLKESEKVVRRSRRKSGEAISAEFVVVKVDEKGVRPAVGIVNESIMPKYGSVDKGVAYMPVSFEEERQMSFTEKKTWERISRDLTWSFPGDGVSVELFPGVVSTSLLVSIPEAVFDKLSGTLSGRIYYRQRSIGSAKVVLINDK